MSRNFAITSIPVLAAASIVLGATLVPTVAHAQDVTPERALVNTVPAPRPIPLAFLDRFSAFEHRAARPVSGETALMVRVEETVPPARLPILDSGPIDGARALLGRWRTVEAGATALSAESE